jgi:hypothetical protein
MSKTKKPQASTKVAAVKDTDVAVQIARTELVIERNQFAADQLHSSWHAYLYRVGWLVCFLGLAQAQGPFGQCWKDIKHYKNSRGSGSSIILQHALLLAVGDSL